MHDIRALEVGDSVAPSVARTKMPHSDGLASDLPFPRRLERGGSEDLDIVLVVAQRRRSLKFGHSALGDGPFERMEDSYQNAGFSQATILRTGYFFVGALKPTDFEHCP
jgi:hypothetical protein